MKDKFAGPHIRERIYAQDGSKLIALDCTCACGRRFRLDIKATFECKCGRNYAQMDRVIREPWVVLMEKVS